MDILAMAFSHERDLAVLCRPRMPRRIVSPFVEATECDAKDSPWCFKLVTFHRCHAKTNGSFYSSDQQETRNIFSRPHNVPVGLALMNNGIACIAWKSAGSQSQTEVVLYGRDSQWKKAQNYGECILSFTFRFLALLEDRMINGTNCTFLCDPMSCRHCFLPATLPFDFKA